MIKQTEGHDRTALRVLHAVDQVADVVQVAGDFGKLDLVRVVFKLAKDIRCRFGHARDVRKAVLGKAKRAQGFVRLLNIGSDFRAVPQLIVRDHPFPP